MRVKPEDPKTLKEILVSKPLAIAGLGEVESPVNVIETLYLFERSD